jgi:hypothetical protein
MTQAATIRTRTQIQTRFRLRCGADSAMVTSEVRTLVVSGKDSPMEQIGGKKQTRRLVAGASYTNPAQEGRTHYIAFPRRTRKSTTFFIQDHSESCCSGRPVDTK